MSTELNQSTMNTEALTTVPQEVMRIACGDGFVAWQGNPFYTGKWNAATDAHIIVGYTGDEEYEHVRHMDIARRVEEYLSGSFDKLVKAEGLLLAHDLIEAFDSWPRVWEMDCLSCLGGEDDNGQVCTVCGGSCELKAQTEDEKFRDPHATVLIGGIAHFKTFTWHKLGPILRMLQAERLRITHGSHNTMLRLEVEGTGIVIGVMPVMMAEGPSLDSAPFRVFNPIIE